MFAFLFSMHPTHILFDCSRFQEVTCITPCDFLNNTYHLNKNSLGLNVVAQSEGQSYYSIDPTIADNEKKLFEEYNSKYGNNKALIHHSPNNMWYEMQDLHVQERMPQLVAISEAYIQTWVRKETKY